MATSLFLAKVIGFILVVTGLGLLINYKHVKKIAEDFFANHGVLYCGALMSLVFGTLLVFTHNVWVKSWEVIITVIGWLALIKGVLLMLFPAFHAKMAKPLIDSHIYWVIASIVALVVGIYLLYQVYGLSFLA